MEDNIRMDSHKLIYHPEPIGRWLKGENIYPIEIEISPSGACNHRCIFCAVDYMGYQPAFLNKDTILQNIQQMYTKGLKSVVCSGEGEPLLNKDMPDIANGIKSYGVDVAMSTNGILFTDEVADKCLASFTWVRFSIASMEDSSYNHIQRGNSKDLEILKENLRNIVKIKRDRELHTTLGVQCLLLPENKNQLSDIAKQLKEIGMNYLSIKPYSQHLHSENKLDINYEEMLDLEKEVKQYSDDTFAVYFRANTMRKIHHKKNYHQCYGLPFMTHIDAKGNVWPCVAHIGTEAYCYGNIYKQSFKEIWEGNKRQEVMKKLNEENINKICREACRLDEINNYLNVLKHPGEHVNFI